MSSEKWVGRKKLFCMIISRGILGNKMPPRGKCPEKANFFRKWSVMIPTFEIHNLGVFYRCLISLISPNWLIMVIFSKTVPLGVGR